MMVFLDTSAFLAVLNANDQFHLSARLTWQEILASDTALFTSNYILLETIAVLQSRFGVESVRLFESDVLPVVETAWVDETLHQRGLSALLAANRRQLSLVDCTSFELMRQMNIRHVFTFDPHFVEQGFSVIPSGQ